MATVTFVPASGFSSRTASGEATLRAVAAPTASYVATTNDVSTVGWEFVVFQFTYTKGDETTLQIKPEGYTGTNWIALGYKATQATAVSELSLDIIQLTGTQTVASPPMSCLGFQKVRCSVKATGGTPTGTIGVTATGAVAVKHGAV